MTHVVRFRRIAELEMNRAVIWYEEQRIGLGLEFLGEFDKTIEDIRQRAASFPVDYLDLRKASLHRFPYKVYFRVHAKTRVSVVGVLHASQRLGRLRGRK